MDQSTNYKHKIDFLISNANETSLIQPTQTIIKKRRKRIHCSECNKKRTPLGESHQICHVCYKTKELKLSGNKIIDDFIRYTQTNFIKKEGKMEFVPHDQFKNIEFIAEGGFSKIYKATWIDGPVTNYNRKRNNRQPNDTVVLKKLNNSKNITSKELNEVRTIIIILY
jgi:serine/threonine protein kinase